MFGRGKKQEQPVPVATLAPVQREPQLSDEDRALLTAIADEIRDSIVTFNDEPLLDDAIEVNICKGRFPILEIAYDSYTVEMEMTIHHFDPEEEPGE